jgi:hypothetical protein
MFDGGNQNQLTTTNGYPLVAGASLQIIPGVGGPEGSFPIYGIVASGTANITVQSFLYAKELP